MQASRQASAGSHVGGFAEGLIRYEVCNEAICNRWPVNQKCAMELAEQSYRLRPLTARALANPLLIARSQVKGLIAQQTDEHQDDTSWLAPVHLWVSK